MEQLVTHCRFLSHLWTAFIIVSVVVGIELTVISYIRNKYMDTPFLRAAFQITIRGMIVSIADILMGKS